MASNATTAVCPPPMKATSNGAFQSDNPLDFALPLIILQICLVVFLTRALAFCLRPLRQPRVIAEIIGGILLGPSAFGRNEKYLQTVFPPKSITVLDTLANLGLLFFLFLVGLEFDLKSLRQTGKKSLSIALAGITFPFALGIGSSFILKQTISKGVDTTPFVVFMGVAVSITAFPVLARILAELKLLTTDVGKIAMSAAAVNDVAAWILLALAIALSGSSRSPLIALWVFLCGLGFVVLLSFTVPTIFGRIARRCQVGEPVDELYICATLTIVLAAGFVTDAIGIHALFGAFVIGILIPKEGQFSVALVEKVEDLVSGLFLPLYFVSSGLKTNVATINGAESWGLLVLVIFTACFGKIVGTVLVSLFCKVPIREALALGFLMNTKGLVELIVLNIGKDRKVLNDRTFAIMVLMALFTTFLTTPLVTAIYKPAKAKITDGNYKHRKIERKDPHSQLRILAAFHSARTVPSIINLIEASRGTQNSRPLCVYAMHLMELSERSSAILMVHKARRDGIPFWNKVNNENPDRIVVAFEAFKRLSRVLIRPMTAISSLPTIHDDICTSAEKQRAAIIILPFHKHGHGPNNVLESSRPEFRWVNRRVLANAGCSVGILVDRGLGGRGHVPASEMGLAVTVLFFGGRDDREGLAYGARMAEHPGVEVRVVRVANGVKEGCDEEALRRVGGWEEREARSAEELWRVVREVRGCDLVVVGRRQEVEMAGGLEWRGECWELGAVGSFLVSNEFLNASAPSVLVVQQHSGDGAPQSCGVVDEADLGAESGEETN